MILRCYHPIHRRQQRHSQYYGHRQCRWVGTELGKCFLAAMKKGTEGFPAFAAQVKKIFSRLEAALGAQSSANCVDCQTKSVVKFHSWEKID